MKSETVVNVLIGAVLGYIAVDAALGAWKGAADPGARDNDNRTVCSVNGKAYYVRPGVGEISYLKRTPDNDSVCIKPLLTFPLER